MQLIVTTGTKMLKISGWNLEKNNLIQHNKFISYIVSKHCAVDPTNFRIRETNVMCENEGSKKATVTYDGSFIVLFLVFNAISRELAPA